MAVLPLPFAAPRWLTPGRVALGAVTLAGVAAATPASAFGLALLCDVVRAGRVDPWNREQTSLAALAILPTAVLSVFHVRRLWRSAEDGLYWRSIGWGAFLGAMNPLLV